MNRKTYWFLSLFFVLLMGRKENTMNSTSEIRKMLVGGGIVFLLVFALGDYAQAIGDDGTVKGSAMIIVILSGLC